MRFVSLVIALYLFWLALSGYFAPWYMAWGLISAVATAMLALRMKVLDAEGYPMQRFGAALTYFPWLVWEIVKSCWSVTKIIVHPDLPISPTMTRVKASQPTTVGIATYSNSITLTPGTITTGVKGNILTVHALVYDGALDLEGGGMDARVTEFERSRS
jgi:multicomponent Na+:H+ antiporter subunit E